MTKDEYISALESMIDDLIEEAATGIEVSQGCHPELRELFEQAEALLSEGYKE